MVIADDIYKRMVRAKVFIDEHYRDPSTSMPLRLRHALSRRLRERKAIMEKGRMRG